MVLIIGGAYQGKLDFAKSTFDLSESDIFTCTGGEIDFSKRCIDHIEEFTPVQRPANDATSNVTTTHFDYHSFNEQLLKLDLNQEIK